jgi:transketolase
MYASASGLRRGGYVLADAEGGEPDLLLMATGSEVSLALGAREELTKKKIRTRVVSMPSWELFEEQPREYRDSVVPPHVKARLAIEAGSPMGWRRYTGDGGDILGMDGFGASAPGGALLREFGFTVENVTGRALALLQRMNCSS